MGKWEQVRVEWERVGRVGASQGRVKERGVTGHIEVNGGHASPSAHLGAVFGQKWDHEAGELTQWIGVDEDGMVVAMVDQTVRFVQDRG